MAGNDAADKTNTVVRGGAWAAKNRRRTSLIWQKYECYDGFYKACEDGKVNNGRGNESGGNLEKKMTGKEVGGRRGLCRDEGRWY